MAFILAAVFVYFASIFAIHSADANAGVFDSGFLMRPVLGSIYLFGVVSLVWIVWEHCFPTLSDYIELETFKTDFYNLLPEWRIVITLVSIIIILLCVLICMWLVPVS